MAHYTRPRIVSVRLPGDVFEALKTHAKGEGRSVSGSITLLVKEEVASRLASGKGSKKLTGFLSHLEVPGSIGAWQAARREASKKLVPAARKSRRSRTSR